MVSYSIDKDPYYIREKYGDGVTELGFNVNYDTHLQLINLNVSCKSSLDRDLIKIPQSLNSFIDVSVKKGLQEKIMFRYSRNNLYQTDVNVPAFIMIKMLFVLNDRNDAYELIKKFNDDDLNKLPLNKIYSRFISDKYLLIKMK